MIKTPDWIKHAVVYQIFPDRFARSPRTQHPRGLKFKPWGSPPEEQGFQGGDLRGIVDKLDYLQDLGINALYLNPVFSSATNHGYHTYDYMEVDPLLGGNAALRELLDAAHAKGIRVILDGVFNHASRGFWPFHHVLENGPDSPYIDWFIIHNWPLRAYHSDELNSHNYAAWWNLPALPKLNTANPGVRDYLFEVARYWLEFGIDGWRLDVPTEIDDDDFWREFRQEVKKINPQAYIVGEIWHPAQRWLQGDMYDAVMNYVLTGPMLSFFGGKTLRPGYRKKYIELAPIAAPIFAQEMEYMLKLYDWEITTAQLNMLDSHDMARALWIMGNDKPALKLCVLLMMTMPGAPCVYYGSEIGLSAGDDPYCREAFPWDSPHLWDHELHDFYRRVIRLRHHYPALRTGHFETLLATGSSYAFRRQLDGEQMIVVFNAGSDLTSVPLDLGGTAPASYKTVWPDQGPILSPEQGRLVVAVPARTAVILVSMTHGATP
ncbi:MAG TPA: glycoside hydrolase family 13 protein [Anaerolineae bacterium]|nr:glycoside hydrolase family 13 protein [Anaerolineae bacterium]